MKMHIDQPWVILGGFNVVWNLDEYIGCPIRIHKVRDFKDCAAQCRLVDIKQAGRYFTWTNKQDWENRVFSKLDRVMANAWLKKFEIVVIMFLPEGEYDHFSSVFLSIRKWRIQDFLNSSTCG